MTMHCQKCRTPLHLDGSLQDLNPAAFKLLTDATGTAVPPRSNQPIAVEAKARLDVYNKVSSNAESPVFKQTTHHGPSSLAPTNPAESFILLSESQMAETTANLSSPTPKSQRRTNSSRDPPDKHAKSSNRPLTGPTTLESANHLFEILSARSDIDHPICTECTELLVDGLQKRLQATTRERDSYIDFLRRAHADIPTNEDLHAAQEKLTALRIKEASAFSELESLERQKATLDEELISLEAESLSTAAEEEEFWAERNSFAGRLSQQQKERDALQQRLEHDTKQLERLQRANVYNDTFSIGHDNHFATINGLRLGRLPDRPVEWAEINAAWGYTCLLLATVAEKLKFRFRGYELMPMGSVSRIRQIASLITGDSTIAESTASQSALFNNTSSRSDVAASQSHQASRASPSNPSANATTSTSRSNTATAASTSLKQQQPSPNQPVKIRTHDLYHSTTSSTFTLPVPGITNRSFDNGMLAFLNCLSQITDHAATHTFPSVNTPTTPSSSLKPSLQTTPPPKSGSVSRQHPSLEEVPPINFPYAIAKGRIHECSIKLDVGFTSGIVRGSGATEEEWTRACKAVLTTCKILLAHASNVGDGGAVRKVK